MNMENLDSNQVVHTACAIQLSRVYSNAVLEIY